MSIWGISMIAFAVPPKVTQQGLVIILLCNHDWMNVVGGLKNKDG